MDWEYKVLRSECHPNDLFTAISRAGREGWELVGTIGYYVYLKRQSVTPDALKGDAK